MITPDSKQTHTNIHTRHQLSRLLPGKTNKYSFITGTHHWYQVYMLDPNGQKGALYSLDTVFL